MEFRYPHSFGQIGGALAGVFVPTIFAWSVIDTSMSAHRFLLSNDGRPETVAAKVSFVVWVPLICLIGLAGLASMTLFRIVLTNEGIYYRSSYGRTLFLSYKDVTSAEKEYSLGIVPYYVIRYNDGKIKIHHSLDAYKYLIDVLSRRLDQAKTPAV